MTDSLERPLDPENIARLEALLFVASGPVTPQALANVLELPGGEVEQLLQVMDESYQQKGGLRLQWHAGRVQMTTAPRMGVLVERFLGLEATNRLSRVSLETLGIIAYQQPITRPQLEAIRGVSSDGVMKSLLGKGLIQEVGRAEGPGRPILYTTTSDFLQYFGLKSLAELPDLDSFVPQPPPETREILKE